jgi:hypothetical protein
MSTAVMLLIDETIYNRKLSALHKSRIILRRDMLLNLKTVKQQIKNHSALVKISPWLHTNFINRTKAWWQMHGTIIKTHKLTLMLIVEKLTIVPCFRTEHSLHNGVVFYRISLQGLSKKLLVHSIIQVIYAISSRHALQCNALVVTMPSGIQAWYESN